MKIGIYGGSFDPIHFGHLTVARNAMKELALDKLIVVPANVSPFKTSEPPKAAVYDRLELLKAAFADDSRVVVDTRELERGGVSYTIDTVRELVAENPGAEFYYLIGSDSEEGLPKWKDIDELKRLVTFKVFPRTKESSTEIRELFEKNAVVLNPDAKLAAAVRQGVIRKNAFCPCRLQKLPEFFCPCDEFKGQLRDPDYHGLCHCRLYLKP